MKLQKQRGFNISQFNKNLQIWETNLVCPQCKGQIRINKSIYCRYCNKNYSIINEVPCFISETLSEHQKSEFEHYLSRRKDIISKNQYYNQDEYHYEWAKEWINAKTISDKSKIICIGGAFKDDLPHVKSMFKFNIDHLAHHFVKIFPEIVQSNVKHIAAKSESLPFKDNYADIVYSSNSLNHVNNPIKTILEIHRVLKPEGKFFLSVYYNSFFINPHESTCIDEEFVEQHLRNLFEIEWIRIQPYDDVEKIFTDKWLKQSWFWKSNIFQSERKKLGWLYAVLKKKEHYNSYDYEVLENYENLLSNFHSAIYYQKIKKLFEASEYFSKIINSKPFLQTDNLRILYSKIRYYSIRDRTAFKIFFNEFKQENKNPFWWKVVIDSSWTFMKRELKKALKVYLPVKEQIFLRRYLKNKEFQRSIKAINQITKKFFHILLKLLPRSISKLLRQNSELIKFVRKNFAIKIT